MSERFVRTLDLPVPVEILWAFHARPDAFALLQPPWEASEVIELPRSLEVGARARLRTRVGPLWVVIEAEHVAYEEGRSFTDRMLRGPFRAWTHEHRCEPTPGGSRLTDAIDYEVPLGALGRIVGGPMVARRLDRMFAYRHEVTRRECLAMAAATS
ncbi:MAG: SRPBCC family protein [Myxococcales bacterium]|nr:SRPBCC family protein [Myxococcales bacterium]